MLWLARMLKVMGSNLDGALFKGNDFSTLWTSSEVESKWPFGALTLQWIISAMTISTSSKQMTFRRYDHPQKCKLSTLWPSSGFSALWPSCGFSALWPFPKVQSKSALWPSSKIQSNDFSAQWPSSEWLFNRFVQSSSFLNLSFHFKCLVSKTKGPIVKR